MSPTKPRIAVSCPTCGTVFHVLQCQINQGRGRFCSRRCSGRVPKKHGHASTAAASPTYVSWTAMRKRCEDPNNPKYPKYGAIGIKVCERWSTSFESFLEDMGTRPEGTTLDRYPDQAGNYEPGNCRWATPKEQSGNIRTNRIVEYDGEPIHLAGLALKLGVKKGTLLYRIDSGWPSSEWGAKRWKGNRVGSGQK